MAPGSAITWGTISRAGGGRDALYAVPPGTVFPWDNANENAAHKWKELDCQGLPFLL